MTRLRTGRRPAYVCFALAALLLLATGLVNHWPDIPLERRYLYPRGGPAVIAGMDLAPILPGQPTSFVIQPKYAGLYGIQLPFVTYGRTNYSTMVFSIYKLPAGTDWPKDRTKAEKIFSRNLQTDLILDWSRRTVFLPIQADSNRFRYAIEISTPDAKQTTCLALVGRKDRGTFWVGDEPRTGRVEYHYTYHSNPAWAIYGGLSAVLTALGLIFLGLWILFGRRWAAWVRSAFETVDGYDQPRLNPWLITAYILVNALVLANAVLHHFEVGFDVPVHLKYAMIMAAKLRPPTPAEAFEYFSPPLAYILPAMFFKLIPSVELMGKFSQLTNWLFGLGLTLMMLKLAQRIRPGSLTTKLGGLALIGLTSALYKTYAMPTRGEPILAFLVCLSVYLAVGCLVAGPKGRLRRWVVLGICLGLTANARQWGFFVFPAVILTVVPFLFTHQRWAMVGRLVLCLAVSFLAGSWFYLHLWVHYGSVTAFNQPVVKSWSVFNQPASFYFSPCPDCIFTAPTANNCPNRPLAIIYSEAFGDYWGEFLYIKGRRHPDFPWYRAAWTRKPMRAFLGRVNLYALAPASMMLAGLIFGLFWLVRYFRTASWTPPKPDLTAKALVSLTALITLLGYYWFLIRFPHSRGNTIKATYMFQFFPLVSLMGGELLAWIKERSRIIFWLIAALLTVALIHNAPALVTRYCLWFY